jgi:hypothetical protein
MDYRIISTVKKFFGPQAKLAKPRADLVAKFQQVLRLTVDEAEMLINTLVAVEFLHETPIWYFNRDQDSIGRAPGLGHGPKPVSNTVTAA